MPRRGTGLVYSNALAKEGDDKVVTFTPSERAYLHAVAAFATEFPHFLIEFEPEQKDSVDAFLSGIVGKLQ